jgi:hypothetical protein
LKGSATSTERRLIGFELKANSTTSLGKFGGLTEENYCSSFENDITLQEWRKEIKYSFTGFEV